jgi:hypothetical protein
MPPPDGTIVFDRTQSPPLEVVTRATSMSGQTAPRSRLTAVPETRCGIREQSSNHRPRSLALSGESGRLRVSMLAVKIDRPVADCIEAGISECVRTPPCASTLRHLLPVCVVMASEWGSAGHLTVCRVSVLAFKE